MQDWAAGPHQLTYRQTERTFGLVARALKKAYPDGAPADVLARQTWRSHPYCDGR